MAADRQLPPTGEMVIQHLQILRAVGEAVSKSLDLDEVIDKSLDALTRVTGHEIASLHLIAPDGHSLLLRGERGFTDQLRAVNQILPMGLGLIGKVAQAGVARRLDEAAEADDLLPAARAAVSAAGIRGFVCVPIRARHRILGTLSLGRQSMDRFSDEEVCMLECTADQIGLALDNARLYSETRHQLEALRRAQTQLIRAERLSAVGELASGVAHEINNPLAIILMQTHILLQAEATEGMRHGLKLIATATERAASIVRSLIAFAEPTSLRRSRCNLVDEVMRVLSREEERLRENRVRVQTVLEDTPPVWGDPTQIREVLFHLVQNAQQAMAAAHGGGTLSIRVKRGETGVRVEVADNGPGIPADHLPRIFNPFFTTKGPGEGRGLGLSVSLGIVKEHGGRLWAENRPEGGALFVVELPLGTPGEPAPPAS
jgi:C4-dicarboxylate-specific signal transduction histidine kinase